jgi:maltose phosphorylase
VNNNWYTNFLAVRCLKYATEAVAYVEKKFPEKYAKLETKLKFNKKQETALWKKIAENMFLPEDKGLGIFLQQEGYLDKELLTVADLNPKERPLNQNWSWDRILRSCFIKQADVLQGLYFFEDQFDQETIGRNFDFYEPRTVHESSLSACVHAIIAARLGYYDKAYEMYLRTARLDLDDYNNDTEDGLHITSMAGTWMAFVEGFGGMRAEENELSFSPYLPKGWGSYSFKIRWRGNQLQVKAETEGVTLLNLSEKQIKVKLFGKEYEVAGKSEIVTKKQSAVAV